MSTMQSQSAKIEAQVVVRDKDGNIKYQGPLVMEVTGSKLESNAADTAEKETDHGRNP